MNWKEITSLEHYKSVLTESIDQSQVVFKHSTRCFISKMMKRKFEAEWSSANGTPYLLDLIRFRDISNLLADELNVIHASPQVIVIRNEKAVFNSSHDSIDATQVGELIS